MTIRILEGHVIDRLRELPAESVHCVVTSPPYYGLRSYGTEPQVWGGDPDCGNKLWIGDEGPMRRGHEWGEERCIPATTQWNTGGVFDPEKRKTVQEATTNGAFCHCGAWRGDLGLEPTLGLYLDHMVEVMREIRRVMRKDATCWLNIGDSYGGKQMQLIPWRLAIRLQDDGWYVRSAICWAKKAPMPESCADRPTTAWEPVFLLTKSAKYFYDQEAVKEDADGDTHGRGSKLDPPEEHADIGHVGWTRATAGRVSKRNIRNVWHLGPEPFPDAHFATFVSEIPRTCIKAGTSEKGVCPKCGAPWCRIVKKSGMLGKSWHDHKDDAIVGQRGGMSAYKGADKEAYENYNVETIGWQTSCSCDAGDPVPATVLDPFLGAGTTGLVADQLQRDAIGIELNPTYAAMAEKRIYGDNSLFCDVVNS